MCIVNYRRYRNYKYRIHSFFMLMKLFWIILWKLKNEISLFALCNLLTIFYLKLSNCIQPWINSIELMDEIIIIWVLVQYIPHVLSPLITRALLWKLDTFTRRNVRLRKGKEPVQGHTVSIELSWIWIWVSYVWETLTLDTVWELLV